MFCCDGERVLNYVALTVFVLSKDYLIKRYSEFFLLMLGELLGIGQTIVSEDYYMVVIFGVVTVIWLLFLLIECEPSDAQAHALWGSRWNTVCYFFLIQIITICLIGLGASFKGEFLISIDVTERNSFIYHLIS